MEEMSSQTYFRILDMNLPKFIAVQVFLRTISVQIIIK